MPYVVPSMPLKCNVWHNYDPAVSAYGAPDIVGVKCNLTPGKRSFLLYGIPVTIINSQLFYTFGVEMLFASLADIRPPDDTAWMDYIECPDGSGRFYGVFYVDDIGKGFANEHRFAFCHRVAMATVFVDATIPVPVPLP